METNHEKSHSSNDHTSRQQRYWPSTKQQKLVLALWTRMVSLYGHKWSSKEGEAVTDGKLTANFMLWCRKTEGLEDKSWSRGFDMLEYRVQEAGRHGDEIWPPSYAEFLGYCSPPVGVQAHKYFTPSLPVPEETKAKRKELGRVQSKKLKSLFE